MIYCDKPEDVASSWNDWYGYDLLPVLINTNTYILAVLVQHKGVVVGKKMAVTCALCMPLAGAAQLQFDPPRVIGPSMSPDYFIGLDVGDSSERLVFGNGVTMLLKSTQLEGDWEPALVGFGETFPSHCDSPCYTVATFGKWTPKLSGLDEATEFNATDGVTITVGLNATTNRLTPISSPSASRTIPFRGLPRPIISAKFTSGGFRLGGSASVRLRNGTILQTVIVTFAGQDQLKYPFATSVIMYRSDNGGRSFDYLSVVADAKHFPDSQEGPNEMDLVVLPKMTGAEDDDEAVLAVIRMDGGDGPVSHPYLNYYRTVSVDGGRSWPVATVVPGAGCARPRLLRMGNSTILSGGRMRNAATSDVLLWHNSNALNLSSPWTPYSISYHHNQNLIDRESPTPLQGLPAISASLCLAIGSSLHIFSSFIACVSRCSRSFFARPFHHPSKESIFWP